MISGAHSIIYSKKPEEDRKFLKDILKLPYVDAGHGWLIFGLPPSEIAIHPTSETSLHEMFLICEDINKFVREISEYNIKCTKIDVHPWGKLTYIKLPGGFEMGVYEPMHVRPKNVINKKGKSKLPSK
jgi:hypothetical protein